jgi:hypothetical protein
MGSRKIQETIVMGRFTLPIIFLLSVAYWIYIPFSIISACGYAFIGYLLIESNNRLSLLRERSTIHATIFLLYLATCQEIREDYKGCLVALLLFISIYLIFQTYQDSHNVKKIFYSGLFYGIGMILFPEVVLFLPLLLIGMAYFHSLTRKTFFALIIGWCAPYWFTIAYAFYFNKMGLFYDRFDYSQIFSLIDFSTYLQFQWSYIIIAHLLILLIVSAINSRIYNYQDKIQTRCYINYIIWLSFICIGIMVLQPQLVSSILPFSFICISILGGHFFTSTHGQLANIFFIFTFVSLILLSTYNLWLTLFNS